MGFSSLESCRGSLLLRLPTIRLVLFLITESFHLHCNLPERFLAKYGLLNENVIKTVAQHWPLSYCVWIWGAKGKDHKLHSTALLCERFQVNQFWMSSWSLREGCFPFRSKSINSKSRVDRVQRKSSHWYGVLRKLKARNYEFRLRFDDRVTRRRCKPIFASFTTSPDYSSSSSSCAFLLAFYATSRLLPIRCCMCTGFSRRFRTWGDSCGFSLAFLLHSVRQFSDSIWFSRISAHVRRDETEQNINYFN